MPTLDWIGKQAVLHHHRQLPFHLLEPVDALSAGDPAAGNLLVQGDNLLALKALLPHYAGQVKLIYIDPPYNTGNEGWVYNDAVNSPEMREWLGKVVGAEAEDLSRHDKWLCMMYPRLQLLKKFLHPDGAIFVSMGDDSIGNLRLLMDEVFSPRRFVASLVWQKRYSRENRVAIGEAHEYILVYASDPRLFKDARNKVTLSDRGTRAYTNPNNDPRGAWQSVSLTAQGYRPNQMYPITAPNGLVHLPPEGRCWSVVEPEFERLKSEGRVWFGSNGRGVPRQIRYLSEVEGVVPWTWWPHEEVGHTDEAKKEVHQFVDDNADAFPTPKPERLLRRIIEIATNPGDVVLDSFAGSGTTGAVAQKLGRRFVLVEMEQYARTLITSRLRAVTAGEDEGGVTEAVGWRGGGGYRFATLGAPLFDESGAIADGTTYDQLARHVWFTETGTPLPATGASSAPLLGVHDGRAVYLLYNGVLGDRAPDGGNVLTTAILAGLPAHAGPKVIYAEGSRLGAARLERERITVKQTPYALRTDR
jgi:DNA modification methylase